VGARPNVHHDRDRGGFGIVASRIRRFTYIIPVDSRRVGVANGVLLSVTYWTNARKTRALIILPVYLKGLSRRRPNHRAAWVNVACLQRWTTQVAAD
jgi:hypothetical protein